MYKFCKVSLALANECIEEHKHVGWEIYEIKHGWFLILIIFYRESK